MIILNKTVCFLCILSINLITSHAYSALIYNESWEWSSDIPDGPNLNTTFGGNNSCNTGECESKCSGGCCKNEPKLEHYGIMTVEQGQQWQLQNHTFTVPHAVDGRSVFRAYAPDCSPNSPYRCNASNNRIRSGLSTSIDSDINSTKKDRWIGFALWIDPGNAIESMDRYDLSTFFALHAPSSHNVSGPFYISVTKDYYYQQVWRFNSNFDTSTYAGLEAGDCQGEISSIQGGYHCGRRQLKLAWEGPPLEGNDVAQQNSILFQPEKDMGQWIYFIIHYKWDNSGNGNGIAEIWMKRGGDEDFIKVVDYKGYVGLMTNDASYLKLGLSATDGDTCPHLQYFDNLKVGDEHSSFAEVNPFIGINNEENEGQDTGEIDDDGKGSNPAPQNYHNKLIPYQLLLQE